MSPCCHLTWAGLSTLKGQAPKSYRQLTIRMTELQLKTTTVMCFFVILFKCKFRGISNEFLSCVTLCEDGVRQMCLCWERAERGGEMCSPSQSLVYPSQTGLLLQAADMRAILKRRHPQLHLTIYNTDTDPEGGKKALPSKFLFASLPRETFPSWSCVEFTAFVLPSNVWGDTDSAHALLLTLCSAVLEDMLFCLDVQG